MNISDYLLCSEFIPKGFYLLKVTLYNKLCSFRICSLFDSYYSFALVKILMLAHLYDGSRSAWQDN